MRIGTFGFGGQNFAVLAYGDDTGTHIVEFAPHLMRAACAVGVDALFLEAHPEPARARSDAAAQLPLAEVEALQARDVG